MSTDGFFTACTTCSARLKVRDLSAIGQIFACPKCGSMVMVEPPEGMEPQTPEASVDEAPTEPVPASAGALPSDWKTTSPNSASWLPVAFGSTAAIVALGGIATFAWLQFNRAEPIPTPAVSSANESTRELEIVTHVGEPNANASDELTAEEEELVTLDLEDESATLANVEPGQPVTDNLQVDKIFDEVNEGESASSELLADQSIAPTISPLTTPDASNSTEPTIDGAATLSNLASLLGGSPDAAAPADTTGSGNDDLATANPSDPTPLPPDPAPSSSVIIEKKDIAKSLEKRIPAVRFEKTQLVDFVRAMMQLSGVPIQIDPAALEQTNNRPTTQISVAAIDKSVLQILQQSLKSVNLIPIIETNSVRISSKRLEDQTPVKAVFPVADLLQGKGRDFNLARLVSTLIEPQSWSTSVGAEGQGAGTITLKDTELHVTNSRRVSIKALVLLEKLRAARGLRPQKKLPKHLVALPQRWQNIERYMARTINMDVWQPSPWTDVIREIEQVTGLQLLVDWQSLAEVGISGETIASLHTRETKAGELLDSFLDSYDLAFIPVDGKTLQLTSKSKMSKQPYIEFHSIKKLGDDGMSVVEELMLDGKAALDSASEFAIVVAHSGIHRSLAN